MPEDRVRRGPRCRVQVAVHQEFSKGEKPQSDRVRVHAPAALATHGALYILKVGANIQIVGVRQFRELSDSEALLEFFGEGNVLAQLAARVFEVKPVAGIRSPQFHRDKNQRGAAELLTGIEMKITASSRRRFRARLRREYTMPSQSEWNRPFVMGFATMRLPA